MSLTANNDNAPIHSHCSALIFVFKLLFQRYKAAGQDTIVLAGAEYGSGSSRDWAAKGPMLLVSLCISDLIVFHFLICSGFPSLFLSFVVITGV